MLKWVVIYLMINGVYYVRETSDMPSMERIYSKRLMIYNKTITSSGRLIFDGVFDIGSDKSIFEYDEAYISNNDHKLNVFVKLSKYKRIY